MCVIFIEAHPDIKQDLCEMNIFMFGRANELVRSLLEKLPKGKSL